MRIGVDLGGTKIEAIALDDEGNMLQRRRVDTPRDDYDAIVNAIVNLVEGIEAELRPTLSDEERKALRTSADLLKEAAMQLGC